MLLLLELFSVVLLCLLQTLVHILQFLLMAFLYVGGSSVGIFLLILLGLCLEFLLHTFNFALVLLAEGLDACLCCFELGHGLHDGAIVEVCKLLSAEAQRCYKEHE